MKPQGAFTAVARAANHAACLTARAEAPDVLLPGLARLGEQMARLLGPALAPLCGGTEPLVRVIEPERIQEGVLAARLAAVAANALLAHGTSGDRTLVSIDGRAVMAQLDRAFGGNGSTPDVLPRSLPRSADIFARRLEGIVADAFGEALGLPDSDRPRIAARDGQYRMLGPFAPGADLALMTLEISEGEAEPWHLLLATRFGALPRLIGDRDRSARAAGTPASPAEEPFAGMMLQLEARLVDMPIKLSRLAGLQPGMTLPIALDRQVPLRVGDAIVARGTVGEVDDRIALQITQTLLSRKDPQ